MPLRDFLDYVRDHSQEPLTWELGGRTGTYVGNLTLVEKQSRDIKLNPVGEPYNEFHLVGDQTVCVCSAEVESDFSRTHTIRNGKIVTLQGVEA